MLKAFPVRLDHTKVSSISQDNRSISLTQFHDIFPSSAVGPGAVQGGKTQLGHGGGGGGRAGPVGIV